MRQTRTIVGLYFALTMTAAYGQQSGALLKARLEPDSLINGERTQLIIEAQSAKLEKSHIEVTPPPGFVVEPEPIAELPSFQGHFTVSTLNIRSTSAHSDIRPYTVLVRLVDDSTGGSPSLAETTLSFNYVQRLSVTSFFLWGAAGILVGYCLRLLVKTLQVVTPPPLAPVPGLVVGPVTSFVQSHYYLVDCMVTLVIGLISMELLLKNNHVPDTGLYWYAALGSGVALGVLTNSELILKLR